MRFFWTGKTKVNEPSPLKDEKGFSLLEVLVAITIFVLFISTFASVMGFSVYQSSNMRERSFLKELCQRKLNEIIVSPPGFGEGLTMKPETKKFEDKEVVESEDDDKRGEDYTYTITYKKFKLPNLAKIMGKGSEEGEGEEGGGGGQALVQKKIFNIAKKHMEKLIWQVEVMVESKNTGRKFSLSAWLMDHKKKVRISL